MSSRNGLTRKRAWFKLEAPEAREVTLCGAFNSPQRTFYPLRRDKHGVWRVCLALEPGIYRYRFLVDGMWQDDPKARVVSHFFDTQQCVRVIA